MGKKIYRVNGLGSYEIIDKTSQQPFVIVENFIVDLWMPIIGVDGLGLYTAYKRTSYNKANRIISRNQSELVDLFRIGKSKLNTLNSLLEDCGFIKVLKPKGKDKLSHKPTQIEIFDPPKDIDKNIIKKYCKKDYTTYSHWLVESPIPIDNTEGGNGTSGKTNIEFRKDKIDLSEGQNSELRNEDFRSTKIDFPISANISNSLSGNPNSSKGINENIYIEEINNKNINNNKTKRDVDVVMEFKNQTPFKDVSRETIEKLLRNSSVDIINKTIEILTSSYGNGNNGIKSSSGLLASCLKEEIWRNETYNMQNSETGFFGKKIDNASMSYVDYEERLNNFIDINQGIGYDYKVLWEKIFRDIEKRINPRTFEMIFKPLEFLCAKDNRIIVLTPNRYIAKCLRINFREDFREVLESFDSGITRVLFIPVKKV
jgi:hypothetical protein